MQSMEKADVVFSSGRSRSYPILMEFEDAGMVEFNIDHKVGLTVQVQRGSLEGGNQVVSWIPKSKEVATGYDEILERMTYKSQRISGPSVLLPIEEMSGPTCNDKAVSITTSTGSSWVLVNGEYRSAHAAGSIDNFSSQQTFFDFNTSSPGNKFEKLADKNCGNRELY